MFKLQQTYFAGSKRRFYVKCYTCIFFSFFVRSRQPTMMSTKSCNEDDFFIFFLVVTCQLFLLALIFSEAKLKHFLSSAELQKRDRQIRRCAPLYADQSPWQKLYHSRNEQSFITFTGFDYATFSYLLSKFTPLYLRYSPYSINCKIVVIQNKDGTRGRPQCLDAAAC